MDTDSLKQSLKHLHASLASTAPLDPELNQLLQTLEADIDALLQRREEVAATQQAQLLKASPAAAPTPSSAPADTQPDTHQPTSETLMPEPQEPLPLAPDAEVLVERAQEISARFAISHPHVEPALRELARILTGIGI